MEKLQTVDYIMTAQFLAEPFPLLLLTKIKTTVQLRSCRSAFLPPCKILCLVFRALVLLGLVLSTAWYLYERLFVLPLLNLGSVSSQWCAPFLFNNREREKLKIKENALCFCDLFFVHVWSFLTVESFCFYCQGTLRIVTDDILSYQRL